MPKLLKIRCPFRGLGTRTPNDSATLNSDFRYLPLVTPPGYSMPMRKVSLLLAFSGALLLPAFGQTPPVARKINNAFVQQQFGEDFTLVPDVAPVFGDLDGDGVDDVVIAARGKNPLPNQAEHNYTVVDPFHDYFGYGDPKVTTTFSEPMPLRRGLMILVIHGAGADAWRSATPKAKYVIVNLPFVTITVRKMNLRKKTVAAIYIEEASDFGESSAVFFDGRKFRYVPMGGSME